ncbi:hypothetical protein M3Y98_00584700 [Aphelenchoides besseyi]|nr:hypothetical protein M3Y98_00584700 [Aphelenchoides besseyi]
MPIATYETVKISEFIFFLCAIYSLCIIFGLLAVKYKFQREYSALVKENRELGLPVITEREAADLIRVKQFYERNKKSTDWQRPVFTVAELERWSRCLAIAELTGQKDHDAMQQIVNEMRRTPMNFGGYGPLFNQTVQTPISTISNQVPPPNYCP